MATIKSYTDISQSKKLAGILPIESADMRYAPFGDTHPWFLSNDLIEKDSTPCWSLSALLDVLKYPSLDQDVENKWSITDWTGAYPKSEYFFDSPVDACVEMIIKLHEQNII